MELYSSSENSSHSDDSSSDGSLLSGRSLDYSYMRLNNHSLKKNIEELEKKERRPEILQKLHIQNNQLTELPEGVSRHFSSLRHLDVSNNRLRGLPESLTRLPLVTLNAKNNLITNENLPKSFAAWSSSLRKLNLSGNNLYHFPPQIFQASSLVALYLGSNHLEELPRNISKLARLRVLCLGGNQLSEVPETLAELHCLEVLIVSDNQLSQLPPCIASLNRLKTLQLHKNRLRTLPTEIIRLKCLSELSLRENPLVVKFVNDMTYNPASLLEISARVVKVNAIPVSPGDLPLCLTDYLSSAHYCVNPRCNGVFFDNRVEHIKFVDFCGKYRVPLLQYLCSSKCVVDNSALVSGVGGGAGGGGGDGAASSAYRADVMRKVLLG